MDNSLASSRRRRRTAEVAICVANRRPHGRTPQPIRPRKGGLSGTLVGALPPHHHAQIPTATYNFCR
ncbi:hypothetical protein ACLOJK_031066 [Asimina triloba]